VGDLQPPSYDYWVNRYDAGDTLWAHINIGLIWFTWIAQVIIVVICMLNFLIAIVSDSYNFIMEREKIARIERREQISYAGMYEITSDEQIEAVILATKLNTDSDDLADQWEGVTKNIKRQISKLEANNVHRFASLKREIVSQTKHVENVIS